MTEILTRILNCFCFQLLNLCLAKLCSVCLYRCPPLSAENVLLKIPNHSVIRVFTLLQFKNTVNDGLLALDIKGNVIKRMSRQLRNQLYNVVL